MVQVLPQVQVFQEFTLVPTAVVEPLRALILGPHYNVRSYATAKSTISVGAYAPDVATTVAWPGRQAGEVVDLASPVVRIDDALVRYFNQTSGGVGYDPAAPNIVELGGSYGWTTVGAFARLPSLPKDVEVGDVVKITNPANLSETLTSVVRGFSRATVASSLPANATVVTGNKTNNVAGSTQISEPAGTPFTVAIGTGAYKPYKVGILEDRYTFTITKAGGTGVAEMSVTTASGLDVATGVVITIGSAVSVGSLGLTITFTVGSTFTYGDTWVYDVDGAFTAPLGTAIPVTGTYAGPSDTTYVVEITEGGVVGTDTPKFKVTTSTGIESAGPFNATATATAISTFGTDPVKIAFTAGNTLCKGDRYSVAATAATEGRTYRLELSDTVPTALAALADANIEIYAKRSFDVLALRYNAPSIPNYTPSTENIVLASGITYYEAGSVLNGLPVRGGSVYVGYRALSPAWTSDVQTITDTAQLSSYFSDLTPSNPLGFGVKKALENANGTSVKFIAVSADTVSGYSAALNKTLEREDFYSVVPMSNDAAVKSLVAGHVTSQSSPEKGRWRIAWFGAEVPTLKRLVGVDSGAPVTATITQFAGDASGVYRLVTATGSNFVTNGVTAGDVVRYQYGLDALGAITYASAVVDRVISETQLLLLVGPSVSIPVASKIEVWRTLSTDQQVDELIASNTYASRRVYHVLAGGATADGVAGVADYFVAAGLAGERSGVAPHQGLTNVALSGFTAVPFTTQTLSGAQLDELASAGFWIVRQDNATGSIYTRKQLSTDVTDLNSSEQSITTNIDSQSYYYKKILAPYIGRTNNVDSVHALIRADLNAAFEFFFNSGTPTLGAQILDGTEIQELRPHAVLRDRLVIRLQLVIPAPINNIELYLVV